MRWFPGIVANGVPGEAYNTGNPKPQISMLDLVKAMEGLLERKLDDNIIEYPDSFPADAPQRRCPDITKARLQVDFEPRVSLIDGLKRFLAWSDEAYTGEP